MNEEHRNTGSRTSGRVALLLALCLAGLVMVRRTSGQQGQSNPAPQQENINCIVASRATNCIAQASVTLTSLTWNPTGPASASSISVCVGERIRASFGGALLVAGTNQTTITYTDPTKCPTKDIVVGFSPVCLETNFSVTGPLVTNGIGLSVAIRTTNVGKGTVTFRIRYIASPLDANIITASIDQVYEIRDYSPITSLAELNACANKVQNPNYVPTMNGCGPAGWKALITSNLSNPPGGADFTGACNTHDLCYEGCGNIKDNCDINFRNDMWRACEFKYIGRDPLSMARLKICTDFAKSYYTLVSVAGQSPYNAAQVNSCVCCKPE